ncbi:MAG: signal peptide peptidase SppA [Planctomycetes bacterium]|nr:signal peptide peptidase SppA [Planctomycetota bacterium]
MSVRVRLLALLALLAPSGCIIYAPVGGGPIPTGLVEVVVRDADSFWTGEKVLMLSIEGELTDASESSLLSSTRNSVADLVTELEIAASDPDVRAVVLRIDSPGGGVTAADLMHRALMRFKARRGIPVLACMMDTAASGGVYVAMAADSVYALPTTVTGSIGVITQITDAHGLMEMLGVRSEAVKSGEYKDMGSPYRALTESERAVFQDLVDSYFERFVAVVDQGRPGLDVAAVRKLADGRVLTAQKALEAGLVDGIAYLDEVLDMAMQEAGLDDAEVITYRVGTGTPRNVYATSAEVPAPSFGLLSALSPSVRFRYEWSRP